MTQNQLEKAVVRATGESRGFIRSLGFGLVIVPQFHPRPPGANRLTKPRPAFRRSCFPTAHAA